MSDIHFPVLGFGTETLRKVLAQAEGQTGNFVVNFEKSKLNDLVLDCVPCVLVKITKENHKVNNSRSPSLGLYQQDQTFTLEVSQHGRTEQKIIKLYCTSIEPFNKSVQVQFAVTDEFGTCYISGQVYKDFTENALLQFLKKFVICYVDDVENTRYQLFDGEIQEYIE